jgi:DNA-damage-inducible protein D
VPIGTSLFFTFESIVCDYNGVECWSARELQKLLGYSKWDKFQNVIEKAKKACTNADEVVDNHFPQVEKLEGKKVV